MYEVLLEHLLDEQSSTSTSADGDFFYTRVIDQDLDAEFDLPLLIIGETVVDLQVEFNNVRNGRHYLL